MLEQFLVSQVFTFFLIFTRIGSGLMVMPGFGETYISPRIRLNLALVISLLLTPVLGKTMPALPTSALSLAILVTAEVIVGLFIGGICRILISATHVAGTIFSYQSGLSSAVLYDVSQSSQGSLMGNFFGLITVVLLFATGMHGFMLRGITESYVVFSPGHFPPIGAFTESAIRIMSDTFIVAVEISTPMIVIGTLLFLGAGVLTRLMPSLQIFFLITSPQILVNFFALIAAFSAMMLWYMEFFRDKLTLFLGYLN
jgi:flagellar biosynthesis protein FliR